MGDAPRAGDAPPYGPRRLLHFRFAGACVETVDVDGAIIGVVVDRAPGVTELTAVLQFLISTIALAGGVGAWSTQRNYGENDSGEA